MNNISFLLGCGISIPAGLPGTWEITNEIICNWDKWYKDDTQYLLKKSSRQSKEYFEKSPYSDWTRKIAFFLNLINKEIKQYYGFIAKIDVVDNYEEIYDFVYHIRQALTRTIDNPLTNRIINCLMHSSEFFHSSNEDKYSELKLLCYESMQFIKNVVHSQLQKKGTKSSGFNIIKNVIEKGNVQSIFTLNHDTLLEEFLKEKNIEFYDGFEKKSKNGVRFWESNFANNSTALQYLKLHGSINWFNFRIDSDIGLKIGNIGLVEKWQSEGVVDCIVEETKYRVEKFPNFLTGTNDKYLEYNYGQYLELFAQFHSLLKTTETLIIAGYGFGDNAVNLRIIDWFENNKNSKIEIISPDIEKTVNNAKGAIYARLKDWDSSRISFIEKGIENTKLSDLKFLQ
jgi:hypothetical protein